MAELALGELSGDQIEKVLQFQVSSTEGHATIVGPRERSRADRHLVSIYVAWRLFFFNSCRTSPGSRTCRCAETFCRGTTGIWRWRFRYCWYYLFDSSPSHHRYSRDMIDVTRRDRCSLYACTDDRSSELLQFVYGSVFQEQLNLYEGRPSMYAQDSRSRPPQVVDDSSSRIYFNYPGSSGGGGGILSYILSMCYNIVSSILQLVLAIFRTNVRPGN